MAHEPLNFFHAAIHVSNLENAIQDYEECFGLKFLQPVVRDWPRIQMPEYEGPLKARITYSTAGSFLTELLEVDGPGMWSATTRDRFHHYGVWTNDPVSAGENIVGRGFKWEATLFDDHDNPAVVFVARGDIRIEMISEVRRPAFEAWISGRAETPNP